MIRAYPREATVAGSVLELHVASDAPRFRVRFYRQGATFGAVEAPSPWLAGAQAGARDCSQPWNWPAYRFELPPDWPSGAYVAQCVECEHEPPLQSADARAGTALFVVRRAPARRVLVNLPLFTYHAYNIADVDGTDGEDEGACLYSGHRMVTLQRPGGGTGGHTWDARNADVYDGASPRQTFAHWDAKALAWLETAGYAVDICTDLDLHRSRIAPEVRLLLAFGHQEYWSAPMRSTVERYLEAGGNVAFFSGNTAWFRVRYDEGRMAIARHGRWSDDDPEERFTGASYRFGGGFWRGPRPPLGYSVRAATHWAFAGTGLRDGDSFGAQHRLVGYECDGLNPVSGALGLAGTSLSPWQACLGDATERYGDGEILGGQAAMTVMTYGNGIVFNAGTVDWPRVLGAREPFVERITRNVIDALSAEKQTGRRWSA